MSAPPSSDRVPPAAAGGSGSQAAQRLEARTRHLFRASLKEGCIHPLYLPLLKYRQAKAER